MIVWPTLHHLMSPPAALSLLRCYHPEYAACLHLVCRRFPQDEPNLLLLFAGALQFGCLMRPNLCLVWRLALQTAYLALLAADQTGA